MKSHDAPSWRNWAGNVAARPARVRMPGSAAEVAAEVTKAAADGLPIRMTGTGHSFTPAASTDGVLLTPAGLTALRSVLTEPGLVTEDNCCPLSRRSVELSSRLLQLTHMRCSHDHAGRGRTSTC